MNWPEFHHEAMATTFAVVGPLVAATAQSNLDSVREKLTSSFGGYGNPTVPATAPPATRPPRSRPSSRRSTAGCSTRGAKSAPPRTPAANGATGHAGVDALVAIYHVDHRELCAHERDWPFRILNILEVVGESMGLKAGDRLLIPVPLYHCFGMVDRKSTRLNSSHT